MGYDTGLADRLRAAGVPVVEVAGWQTRGSSSFSPQGSVNHHTAGSPNGATPSLNTVIYGRSDLPGPLANVLQSREPDGNDKAYLVAAGRANHAGSGGWKGLSGNSSVYGLEIEHTGTSVLPMGRQQVAARIHAAMLGADRAAYVCQHSEWTSRKIDAATQVDADEFRALVAAGGGAAPTPDMEDDDMLRVIARNNTPGEPYAALGHGYCIRFADHELRPSDSRDRWRPWFEYHAGVAAGYYGAVKWVDEGTFDNACETARNNVAP